MGLHEYNAKKKHYINPPLRAPLLGTTLEAPLPAMDGLGEEQGLQ